MATTAYVIATISTIGGAIGYTKSGSTASLIAGSVFGILFGTAGYLVNERNLLGSKLATVASAVLIAAMFKKALNFKPVPVLMTILGIVGLFVYGQKWNRL